MHGDTHKHELGDKGEDIEISYNGEAVSILKYWATDQQTVESWRNTAKKTAEYQPPALETTCDPAGQDATHIAREYIFYQVSEMGEQEQIFV